MIETELRFAFISSLCGSPWGGSELLWSQTAETLRKQGCPVFASVHGWSDTPQAVVDLRLANIQVYERHYDSVSVADRTTRVWQRICRKPETDPVAIRMMGCMERFNPSLVCISNGATGDGLQWIELCQERGFPYVIIAQAATEAVWPCDRNAERLITAYTSAVASFFVSRRNLELLETQLGISLPNAEIVRNPVNVPFESTCPWPERTTHRQMACVARLDPIAKGQDLLLQVLSDERWRSRDWHLNFYGSGNNERALKRLRGHLGLTDRVTFHGHVHDIPGVWSQNHILVLPSRFEGLPLSLVEAMLCGRCAVVTDVAGNTEVVTDGNNGFVAPAPTVPLLAEALQRAWDRRDQWQAMGLLAAEEIRRRIPQNATAAFACRLRCLLQPRSLTR